MIEIRLSGWVEHFDGIKRKQKTRVGIIFISSPIVLLLAIFVDSKRLAAASIIE